MLKFSRRRVRRGVLIATLAVGLSACASGEDWAEWRSHKTHFASGEHMAFSLKNMGSTPHVNRSDQSESTAQSWWGKPVMPRPGQVFED